jgi:hypothetical protein
MRMTKRIGWLVLGTVLGGITVSTVTARQLPPERPERRLIVLRNAGPMEYGNAHFIKDAKTGACWLAIHFNSENASTLAPAPPASCDQ